VAMGALAGPAPTFKERLATQFFFGSLETLFGVYSSVRRSEESMLRRNARDHLSQARGPAMLSASQTFRYILSHMGYFTI
jgi:hypothetical protein